MFASKQLPATIRDLYVTATHDMEDGSKASAEERMPIGVDSPPTVWHIVVNDLQEGDELDHGKTAQETGSGGVRGVLRETPTVVRRQVYTWPASE